MPSAGWNGAVLALDFDGVVVDALHECAAVTYFAGTAEQPDSAPSLDRASRELPTAFIALFRSVRPYCRTLTDFMVTNHIDQPIRSRTQYQLVRRGVPPQHLDREAAIGERLRSHWRLNEPELWLASHHPYDLVLDALRGWEGPRWIVSAKDTDSIRAILHRHCADDLVDTIVGSCGSKVTPLRDAAGEGAVLFLDDNLDHVITAADIAGVTAHWAAWGYAAPDDHARARTAGIRTLQQHELTQLTPLCLKGTHS